MLEQTDIPLEDELTQHDPRRPRMLDIEGKPKRQNKQPERDLVAKPCIKWLRQVIPGSIVATVPNEQRGAGTKIQRMRYGAARKASGVVTGFVDCVALIPGGRTLLIEWKAPGGKVSDAQREMHTRAKSLGHDVIVAASLENLRWALNELGVRTIEAPGQLMVPPDGKFR